MVNTIMWLISGAIGIFFALFTLMWIYGAITAAIAQYQLYSGPYRLGAARCRGRRGTRYERRAERQERNLARVWAGVPLRFHGVGPPPPQAMIPPGYWLEVHQSCAGIPPSWRVLPEGYRPSPDDPISPPDTSISHMPKTFLDRDPK